MVTQKSLGDCLFCIPLRFGISLIAVGHLAHAFVCILVLFTHDLRLQSGGYSTHTTRLQAIVGCFGLWFGFIGLSGASDSKISWIKSFAHFQDAKIVVSAIVFVFDMVALTRCPEWAGLLGSKESNPALYAISSKGQCQMARLCYVIGFTIDFGICYYFAWVTHLFCKKLQNCPGYLIQFSDSAQNHTQVKLFDSENGEPIQYLGPQTSRTLDGYGAAS
mmetsp:Transcript_59510/g.134162  ORF Transcript_59510/g.134162 Transcript_59510/m.134162 type:complete len:219 (-) Transcript_59510:90-746(-)